MIKQYKRQCPFCKRICYGYEGSNLFCGCNAKYYWQDQVWLDRKTGKEVRTMTNREYLATLDTYDFVNWLLFDAPAIGRMSTQSITFLTEWLDDEYAGWITLQERSEVIMKLLNEENRDE